MIVLNLIIWPLPVCMKLEGCRNGSEESRCEIAGVDLEMTLLLGACSFGAHEQLQREASQSTSAMNGIPYVVHVRARLIAFLEVP